MKDRGRKLGHWCRTAYVLKGVKKNELHTGRQQQALSIDLGLIL